MRNNNTAILVAGLAVFGAFALAAVVIVQPGPESTQRLALLFGVLGTGVAALVAALKAGEAASNTNGKLDARIEAGVLRANAARRRGDEPLTPDEIDGMPTAELERRLG